MKTFIAAFLVVVALLACTYSIIESLRKQRARDADLRELGAAFGQIQFGTEGTNVVTLSDLTNVMAKSGKRLANPYAINPHQPSYRVGPGLLSVPVDPNQVIIEETENVDRPYRFKILGDGSVQRR